MNSKTLRFTASIALLLIGLSLTTAINLTVPHTVRAAPGVLYAAPSAVGSGDCSSWANACTLQTALMGAVSGDEIWVKRGVHYPGTGRADTFTLKNGVAVYGGFAGTETSQNQRDWVANKTILSGDIDQNDTNTDGNFIAETTGDIVGTNAYHVVTGSGTDATAVLDGFIITAGLANGSVPNNVGGGVYNVNGSPTIANVTLSGNATGQEGSGGGMYNDNNSNPQLTRVTFSGNSAKYGGGMHNEYLSSPTLTNVAFSGNSANYGGGISNASSSPTLKNVTFSGNSASINGGGVHNYNYSSPALTNVTSAATRQVPTAAGYTTSITAIPR